jgi:membrane protease YdiL (CAAX protease family)
MKETIIVSVVGLAFCAIVMFLFTLFTKTANKKLIVLLLGLLLLDVALTMLPNINWSFLNKLEWNWQGKILSILWCVLFICFTKFLTKEESGFTWKINKSAWLPFIIICVIGISVQLLDVFSGGGLKDLHFGKEHFFYELTMPGLSEEMAYRGIILGLLNKVFVSRKNILGATVGWGILIQAIIFGGGHSFYFNDAGHIQFALVPAIITGIIGLVIGWLREKSGNIVLPIIFHNLFNVFPQLLALFA